VERSPAEIDSIQIDIARFKRIIQINPRNAFAFDTLGGLYKALGRFKDAITAYQQAIALDSTKPSYFYQLGLMYSAERRDQEAMDAFQRVLGMNPQHTLAHASLGSLYRKLGLNDLAQQHIDIALRDVYEEENEYNQACLEAICGNAERALELLQVAIEDNPSYINWAQHDPDLDILRHDERFYLLIQSFAQNK
jgi:tetratricopeptide (TPR) repeat protein